MMIEPASKLPCGIISPPKGVVIFQRIFSFVISFNQVFKYLFIKGVNISHALCCCIPPLSLICIILLTKIILYRSGNSVSNSWMISSSSVLKTSIINSEPFDELMIFSKAIRSLLTSSLHSTIKFVSRPLGIFGLGSIE